MPGQFFPTNDQEYEAFLTNLLANIGAVMTALSLPATFDDALVASKAAFSADLATHVASQAQAAADRAAKDASKAVSIEDLREMVAQLRANSLFTNAHATSLGLPVLDTTPTPIKPGSEVPSINVDTSAPQQHSIGFWQTTETEGGIIAKPEWARAARIMHAIVATGQPAPAIETMDFLATDTSTPYTWIIPGAHVGKDIWYRAAWETPRGELGPWSDPAKGTVTG